MFSLTFTSGSPAHDLFWWWQTVVVPVLLGLLSSLLAFWASLYLARNTEWYRRLARWEPYGKELWLRNLDVYSEALRAARASMWIASTPANTRVGEEARPRELKILTDVMEKFDAAGLRRQSSCRISLTNSTLSSPNS